MNYETTSPVRLLDRYIEERYPTGSVLAFINDHKTQSPTAIMLANSVLAQENMAIPGAMLHEPVILLHFDTEQRYLYESIAHTTKGNHLKMRYYENGIINREVAVL